MLKDHQKEAIAHLKEWKVGALFMEAGTGKTRVACQLIDSVEEVDLVVWFGPLRTIREGGESVVEEVKKSDLHKQITYFGVESIGASDRIYMEAMNAVQSAKCPFVVVDESIKIKNSTAKRTKRLLEIGRHAEYKLILNGTPLSRNVLDIWAQMQFLSPKILNMTENKFKNTFCRYKITEVRKGGIFYRKELITGYENIDYLNNIIRNYVYECDLSLAVTKRYHEVRYTLDKDSEVIYKELKEKYLSDDMLSAKNNNIFIEMTSKMQHTYCVTEGKFKAVDEILKGVDPSKTIIFTRFVKSAEECKKRYPECLVLSYQKESFGLNLQTYSNTIYFDKVWDYALRTQSLHRTYRIGQDLDCEYWDITGNVGLESMIDNNIAKKITMVEYFRTASEEQIINEL